MMKRVLALLLALVMVFALCACNNSAGTTSTPPVEESTPGTEPSAEPTAEPLTGESGKYTYRTYLAGIAKNWNPHDYEDNAASDMMSYLIDGLYMFAFNDELHPMEDASFEDYEGYVILPSMAADYPTDITEQVKAEHPEWIPADATSGYAWSIPLRDDLYFDTGYHITADTFVEGAKRLLDPKMQNYRSTDVYANANGIVGAEAYFKQGSLNYHDCGAEGVTLDAMTKNDEGQYVYNDMLVYIAVDYAQLEWTGGDSLKDLYEAYGADYFGTETWDALVALMDEDGMVPCTDDNLALLSGVTTANPAWGETDDDLFNYLVYAEQMPDGIDFGTVGIYAPDEYTLVEVFKASTSGFSLYYGGIQDQLLLVEPDVYDSCIKQDEAGNYYSTYCTSAETSPSYGPYSMTAYQTEKMLHFSRNDKWFGYNEDTYHVYKDPTDGQTYHMYETTDVDIQQITEMTTAKSMFLTGQFVTYGLQSEDYDQYGFSDYLYASPGATVFFFLLTGDLEGLQAREAADDFDQSAYDLETITIQSFRKAVGASFDKQAYCDDVSPSTTPGYGLYGDTIIADPDTCTFYRDSDQAKQVLVDFYSINLDDFGGDLDAAVDSITGYDPEAAKELYTQAFQEALDAGYITDNDGDGKCDQAINIEYGVVDALTDTAQKRINWLTDHWLTAVEGTPFEGKVAVVPSRNTYDNSTWADALKSGQFDVEMAGWNGSQMDPYGLLQAYTWPSYSYAANWYDTTKDMMTLELNGESITMSVYDWAEALNGSMTPDSNGVNRSYGENDADAETRLTILAAIEGKILQTYTYLPFINDGSKFLLSQQVYYVVEDYNPVMARGGIQYLRYNYDDAEWADYVNAQLAEHEMLQY